MAQVQFRELDEALEGVEGDIVELVPAEPQLADDGEPPEGLLGQICHHISVEEEFLETVERPERLPRRPGDVVVSDAEGVQGEEVVEAPAGDGVSELIVVEIEVQKGVHDRPRLAT